MAIDDPISLEAKDLLPETWAALLGTARFGAAALERRHDRVIRRIFGVELTVEEQDLLDDRVIEYAGKRLALVLCDPGIDYWRAQIISQSAGERESSTYQDRAEHLAALRKQWTTELTDLWLDVEPLLPVRPGRVVDAPRVVQAGETVPHVTASIDDLEPLYGPPDTTTTQFT